MNTEWFRKRRALLIIIVSCILLAIVIVKIQPDMQHKPEAGYITPVKVIEVKRFSVRPAIKGFGVVEPDILLESKAEVSGKIIYVHPQLRDGAIFPKDTVVLRIEEKDYHSSLQQAEANVAVIQAKLREIKVTIKNTRVDLSLVKKKLTLAKNDLARVNTLLKKNLIAQSSADVKQTEVLKLRQEVQNLSSKLNTLPEQQASLDASLANAQAALETKQYNLGRTTIRTPFNARISKLMVDEGQFIAQGGLLFTAQTTDKVLINAQFSLDQFRSLARSFSDNEELITQAFRTGFSNHFFAQLGLSAKVRLADHENPYWQATVERISSTLDPVTRTLGIIVSIANPYAHIKPGVKPPLMKGMYTEILLRGKPRDVFLVPRDALHEYELFISDNENRLERRAIKPVQLQDMMALFATGLKVGEKVIVSDLFPAIPGIKLKLVLDKKLQQQIADWAETQ
jgi:membrane fusion protein, multidrug efflux system